MSGEIIAIWGVGIALAGLILNGQRGVRAEIAGLRGEIAETHGAFGRAAGSHQWAGQGHLMPCSDPRGMSVSSLHVSC